jgi:hypothetical protein
MSMTDTQVMATLRNELLNAMYATFPRPLDKRTLGEECRTRFLTRDKQWYTDALNEQVKVLEYSGLVRPSNGGYTLTERGRMDRQQAARFFPVTTPPDAA